MCDFISSLSNLCFRASYRRVVLLTVLMVPQLCAQEKAGKVMCKDVSTVFYFEALCATGTQLRSSKRRNSSGFCCNKLSALGARKSIKRVVFNPANDRLKPLQITD
jgi:hypothetical protein